MEARDLSERPLCIDAAMGMAGDMFTAALIDLGAPDTGTIGAMTAAGSLLGGVTVSVSHQTLPDGSSAKQINVALQAREPLPIVEAPAVLERALRATGIRGGYAGFAQRALAILCQAERTAHGGFSALAMDESPVSVTIIGRAHTPYVDRAPYQPRNESDAVAEDFFIELAPLFSGALERLDSFSHVFVLSYLERSSGYSLLVRPPWKDGASHFGLFATRSPNRPSPIGLTRVRLRRIEGTRLYTEALDLFDGTPILDIKPYVQSLDSAPTDCFSEEDAGNDGWLAGSEHLELHRLGILHRHVDVGQLHEAQDIVLDVVGAAWALQSLGVNLQTVVCIDPVRVGGGETGPTSHGRLHVPAPAVAAILAEYDIPHEMGPLEAELLTPTGAAILAALSPSFVPDRGSVSLEACTGAGLGQRVFGSTSPNVLRLYRRS